MNTRTTQTVVEMLKVDGEIEDALLDDFVCDTASEIATQVNNSGLEDQVEFLLDNNWSGEDILYKVKEKREEKQ